MRKQIKQKGNRQMARMCTELETNGASKEHVDIAKKYMGWFEQDVLEILKITLQGK